MDLWSDIIANVSPFPHIHRLLLALLKKELITSDGCAEMVKHWQLCRTIGPLLSQRFPLASAKTQSKGGFIFLGRFHITCLWSLSWMLYSKVLILVDNLRLWYSLLFMQYKHCRVLFLDKTSLLIAVFENFSILWNFWFYTESSVYFMLLKLNLSWAIKLYSIPNLKLFKAFFSSQRGNIHVFSNFCIAFRLSVTWSRKKFISQKVL